MTLAYGKSETPKVEQHKKDFMTYLGGKKNLYCDLHKYPLTASTQRESLCMKCKRKKEFFKCCTLSYNTCLCKSCADSYDLSVPNFIQEGAGNGPILGNTRDVGVSNDTAVHTNSDALDTDNESNVNMDTGVESNVNMDTDVESNVNMDIFRDFEEWSDDDLIEPYQTYSVGEEEELLEPYQVATLEDNLNNEDKFDDNFEDFVIHAGEPDAYHEENHEYFPPDTIPTTDTGENAQTIIEDDVLNQNRVSGHVILNQCGSLLSRRTHDISGSSKHKFFLQKSTLRLMVKVSLCFILRA